MKVLYFKKTGIVKCENLSKDDCLLFECGDGYHPIPYDAVYKDVDGTKPSLIIFFNDLITPHGTAQTNTFLGDFLRRIDIMKQVGNKFSISTPFWRQIGAFMDGIGKFLPYLVLGGLVLFVLFADGGISL